MAAGPEQGGSDQPGELLTYDKLFGDLLWQHAFDTLRVYPPFIANGNVYTINRGDLYGFDLSFGAQTCFLESYFEMDVAVANHAIYLPNWNGIRVLANERPLSSVSPSVKTHGFQLYSNYPNPFNPVTQISYDVGRRSHVRLTIYNVLGQQVARPVDAVQSAGHHCVMLDGSVLSSGVYIYQIEMKDFRSAKKMVLIR